MIKITRSFGRTLQVRQYEPASFFCALETECALNKLNEVNDGLYEQAKLFVEKDIENFQANDLAKKLEGKLKVAELDLESAKRKNLPLGKEQFAVELLKLEIKELKQK